MTRGSLAMSRVSRASRSAVTTSRYSGSPDSAGLLRAVEHGEGAHRRGSAATNAAIENGRNRCTFTTPTFSPACRSQSTVSWAISPPEPIDHEDALGFGIAHVVEELYWRPVRSAKRSIVFCTMSGQALVEAVAGLAGLEEHVRVLRGPAQHRAVGGERALAVRARPGRRRS